jgi:thioredoxin-related protein
MTLRWLLLAFSLLAQPALAEVRDPVSHFFSPKLGDFRDDLQTAVKEGKSGVLIMFEQAECPFCDRMLRTILNQSQVQDWYRQHFVIFDVDVRGGTAMVDFKGRDTTEKAFALEHRARATPTFVFFDRNGDVAARFTGTMQSTDEFLLLGRYVVEGAYKTVPFNVYKRQAQTP